MTTPNDRTGFIYRQHDCLKAHDPETPRDQLHRFSGNDLWRCPDCGTIWEPVVGQYSRGGNVFVDRWRIVARPARDAMIHEIYQELGMEGPLS